MGASSGDEVSVEDSALSDEGNCAMGLGITELHGLLSASECDVDDSLHWCR